MPSTRSKKARARRSREADIMSDIENMDILLGTDQYNQIERDLEQMTNFSNDFGRNENRENTPTRETSSQENEIRNMPSNRGERTLPDNMEILTGEMNFRISQEMNSIINGMNSQIERAISSAISERIIPQMQNVVENVLARELREVPNVSGRLHVQTDEAQNSNRDNLRDLDPSLDLNRMESEEVSPHNEHCQHANKGT